MAVYVKKPGTELPEKGPYYVFGENGAFMKIDQPWVSATVPVTKVPGLEKVEPGCRYLLPPIPEKLTALILAFFHDVAEKWGTEVAVMLHHNFETGEWAVTCPKQTVGPATVRYEMTDRVDGMKCVGTAHSHVNMSAFHSGTDVDDEAQFDGIHITIGRLKSMPQVEFDCEVVVRGNRFTLGAERVLTGVEKVVSETDTGYRSKWYRPPEMYEYVGDPAAGEYPPEWWDQLEKTSWSSGWTWPKGRFAGSTKSEDETETETKALPAPKKGKKRRKNLDDVLNKNGDGLPGEPELGPDDEQWGAFDSYKYGGYN